MARFPLIEEAQLTDPEARAVYEEIRAELGFGIVPNIFKSMATRPPILRANWNKFRATMLQGRVPRTIKEMIGVVISQANDSQYALQVHLHGLSALGMSEEVLQTLVADFDNCPLPLREKAILRFGLLAATDPLALSDAHFAELRRLGLDDDEIFEIVATADLFTFVNTYTDAAAVEIDQL
jgi:uncharacterized peroxidase-related enzyme